MRCTWPTVSSAGINSFTTAGLVSFKLSSNACTSWRVRISWQCRRTVSDKCVTITDTDRAIDFYVDKLGFEKVVDVPMGPAMRWVEVALPGAPTTIALAPPPEGKQAGGGETGICLDTSDVDADHAALRAAGVDVDEQVTRWGGPVPPMAHGSPRAAWSYIDPPTRPA